MPPCHSYWTIVLGGTATSFRAATQEELIPTLHQLRKKDAAAALRWFARGRLWSSPTEARAAAQRPSRPRKSEDARDRDWRPGGAHSDPRDRFAKKRRDQKKRASRPPGKS